MLPDLEHCKRASIHLYCFFLLVLVVCTCECIIAKLVSGLFFQVFLEYADVDSSSKARQGLNGRKFGGNQVVAVFYPENKFSEGDYEA